VVRSALAMISRSPASDGDQGSTVPAAARPMERRALLGAMSRALAGLAAIGLAMPADVAFAGGSGQEPEAEDARAPVRTAKERLGSKAADDQRVDNCKVPPELRGPKPRLDDCAGRARPR
jgi:hypothetical protein